MYKPTLSEINQIKIEYSKKKYIGTNKYIDDLDTRTAIYILKSRRVFQDYINSVHESHTMTEWRTEILAPAGTPRFYAYRKCINCGSEQYHHPAGQFIDDELKRKCN